MLADIQARVSSLENSASQHPPTILSTELPYSGTASSEAPRVASAHLIPPNIRKDIVEGKDVNLVSLLIASQDLTHSKIINCGDVSVTLRSRNPRLNKKLSFTEFVLAFGVYRDIVCSAFLHRRQELDHYMHLVVDLAYKYGGSTFYDYHRSFSAKAAAALSQFNFVTDWSYLDTELFCRHFAGLKAPVCQSCQSSSHSTDFCPSPPPVAGPSGLQAAAPTQPVPQIETSRPSHDKQGRVMHYQGNNPICNNFNSRGCFFSGCRMLHICSYCRNSHARTICHKFAAANKKNRRNLHLWAPDYS
ncbi:uncharacterized protein WCC33_003420 [Rhinophrynus dorsalis]